MTWPQVHPLRRVPVVTVVTPPDALLTAEDLNRRLKLDISFDSPISDADQELITDVEAMISAATASLDGPSGSLGRALGPQTLCLSVQTCGETYIPLPFPPIIEIVSIEYDTDSADAISLDASAYKLRRGAVYFTAGAPTADDLRITFRAGYENSDSPPTANVPQNLLHAIRLMVGDMWEYRESAAPGTISEVPSSATVKALVAPFRVIAS